jgi:hypothetical protein
MIPQHGRPVSRQSSSRKLDDCNRAIHNMVGGSTWPRLAPSHSCNDRTKSLSLSLSMRNRLLAHEGSYRAKKRKVHVMAIAKRSQAIIRTGRIISIPRLSVSLPWRLRYVTPTLATLKTIWMRLVAHVFPAVIGVLEIQDSYARLTDRQSRKLPNTASPQTLKTHKR